MIQNLLIVTDHSTHYATNSLYELAVALMSGRGKKNIWVCSRALPENLEFFEGKEDAPIYATLVNKKFSFHPLGFYLHQAVVELRREDINAVIVRMPQPLNKRFLQSLEIFIPARKIVNSPKGTIETSSKEFLLQVKHLCPSPVLCRSVNDAVDLSRENEIVLKPLYSYGGVGIVRLSLQYYWEGDKRYPASAVSHFLKEDDFPMLAMNYLPNVTFGDKRTIVVNQQIVGSALRLPAPDSWICNVAHGGRAIMAQPDEQELKIERELTPILFEKGVVMYGFDTLVADKGLRVLSEINTLSIGGLGPMRELSGKPILKQTAQLLWDYLGRD
jgi:glutathione synthase